jgi:hypothetical protein
VWKSYRLLKRIVWGMYACEWIDMTLGSVIMGRKHPKMHHILQSFFATMTNKECINEFNDLPIGSPFYITCRGDSLLAISGACSL